MVRADLSALPAYIPGTTIPGALKLASNEVAHGPLPSVAAALTAAIHGINRYPDMAAADLRSTIASWLSDATPASTTSPTPASLTADNIAVGTGSSALCLQAISATCASANDEVLFAWRSFEAYPILTRVVGATPVQVPLTADLRHDLPAMARAITPNTRLIFLCNPNNPTGTTITTAEFTAFMQAVPPSITVILDEAYLEYNTAPDSPIGLEELSRWPNLALCRTFSKAYGLAGLRVGYMVGHPDFITAVSKVAVPFSVSSLAQVAARACLEPAARTELLTRVEDTITQRDRLLPLLRHCCPSLADAAIASQANFVWFALGDSTAHWDAALRAEGVIVRAFPGEGIRVTVTTAEETQRFLDAVSAINPPSPSS